MSMNVDDGKAMDYGKPMTRSPKPVVQSPKYEADGWAVPPEGYRVPDSGLRVPGARPLRTFRLQAGLRVGEAVRRLRIGRSALYNYEAGDRAPDAELLGRIALLYGLGGEDLLGLCLWYAGGRTKPRDSGSSICGP